MLETIVAGLLKCYLVLSQSALCCTACWCFLVCRVWAPCLLGCPNSTRACIVTPYYTLCAAFGHKHRLKCAVGMVAAKLPSPCPLIAVQKGLLGRRAARTVDMHGRNDSSKVPCAIFADCCSKKPTWKAGCSHGRNTLQKGTRHCRMPGKEPWCTALSNSHSASQYIYANRHRH